MRINTFLLFFYFFMILGLLSQQETLTGKAVLVFDDGIPAAQLTDTDKEVVTDGNIADTIIEAVPEEVVADIVEPEQIEIVADAIQSEEPETRVEDVQEIEEEILEKVVVPLDEIIVEEVITVEEALTVEKFMTELHSDTVVVIGENAPARQVLGALHLAGKFGLRVVKDSAVEDKAGVHAIALGTSSVNSVSAFAFDHGAIASDEGDYFIYENKETGTVILVVAGGTPKETRKAVQDLLKY